MPLQILSEGRYQITYQDNTQKIDDVGEGYFCPKTNKMFYATPSSEHLLSTCITRKQVKEAVKIASYLK